MIILGSKTTKMATPMYWKSGIIKKVCFMKKNVFEQALNKDNLVKYINDEIYIKNLTLNRKIRI